MAKYIDAEKIKFTGYVSYDYEGNVFVALEDVKRAIAQTPDADVVEVRHGKWERMEDDTVYWYVCSECKGHIPKTEYGNDYCSDYCPRCGTIMDLEDDEK